jgi:hypothetical protein
MGRNRPGGIKCVNDGRGRETKSSGKESEL